MVEHVCVRSYLPRPAANRETDMSKPLLLAALSLFLAGNVMAAEDDSAKTEQEGTAKPAKKGKAKEEKAEDKKAEPTYPDWDVAIGAGAATDYVFRGISQSNRNPSWNSYVEYRYTPQKDVQLYAGTSIYQIDFPNEAFAEVDFYAGVRPTFDKVTFDFGFWYYWYPGGRTFNGSDPASFNCTNGFLTPTGFCNTLEARLDFYEVYGKATYTPNDKLTLGVAAYYSPSWLNTGAPGTYASWTAKYVLPDKNLLPDGLGWYISGEWGNYFFGDTKDFYGNIPLPDYATWNVGLAFTYDVLTLDLRYYDTDLSEAQCNVLTGDDTATFRNKNVTDINASGLGSKWCGAAFVGKLSFDLTAKTNILK